MYRLSLVDCNIQRDDDARSVFPLDLFSVEFESINILSNVQSNGASRQSRPQFVFGVRSWDGYGDVHCPVDLCTVGSFAHIYVGEWKRTKRKYAVKCLFKYGLSKSQEDLLRYEIRINERLGSHATGPHPHLVFFDRWFETDACIYLVCKSLLKDFLC